MVNPKIDDPKEGSYRVISMDKYIVAGVITFLIFSLGLTLGFILEDQRYNKVEEINQEQEANYISLQLQYLYLTSWSNYDNCPVLSATLKKTIADLSDSLSEVIAYEEGEKTPEAKKVIVQRRYILDNLRYWLLAKESKEKCHLNIVPILYFYTNDCPSCSNQGAILTYFKKIFGEQVLVFPINLDLREEETMVEVVMGQFNVTKYPSLIINDHKYEGVVKKEEMEKIICSSLTNATLCTT